MKRLHKILVSTLIGLLFLTNTAFAVTTIFPNEGEVTGGGELDCQIYEEVVENRIGVMSFLENPEVDGFEDNGSDYWIACALKTGKVKFWLIPLVIKRVLDFLIQIASLISILMILVGAYYYIAGGVSDDKEKGKTIISYALGGLVLVLLSWSLVNLFLLILTG